MASAKQKAAARRNIKKAQAALRAKKRAEGKPAKKSGAKKSGKRRAAKKTASHAAPQHHVLSAHAREFVHGMAEGARDVASKKPLRKVAGHKDDFSRGYREGVRSARAAKRAARKRK